MRWYAEGFSQRSKMKLKLELDEQIERFGPDVETGLFRILQEALTNVHRHAGAETVHIRVTSAGGRLTLSIQDDGKGICPTRCELRQTGVTASAWRVCANAVRFWEDLQCRKQWSRYF